MLALFMSLFIQAPPAVVSLNDPNDTIQISSPIRVVEVRDLRRMASISPEGIGVSTIGVFEERVPLRSEHPVSKEVETLCKKWLRPAEKAIPVRLELLSFESWPVPADGPDPFYALARIRVVSVDSSRPGLLLEPQAKSERKGVTGSSDQAVMLASCLRDVLSTIRPDMKPVPTQEAGMAPPIDAWADPRRGGERDTLGLRLQHSVSLVVAPAWNSIQMGLRYEQCIAGQAGWTRGYWGAIQVRGPWSDTDLKNVWAGDLLGGQFWWRRLDDGRSKWSTVSSAGGLFGFERFQRMHGPDTVGARDWWIHPGLEGRTGLRWSEPTKSGWVFEGGLVATVRIPSSLRWLDPGVYGSAGWRF